MTALVSIHKRTYTSRRASIRICVCIRINKFNKPRFSRPSQWRICAKRSNSISWATIAAHTNFCTQFQKCTIGGRKCKHIYIYILQSGGDFEILPQKAVRLSHNNNFEDNCLLHCDQSGLKRDVRPFFEQWQPKGSTDAPWFLIHVYPSKPCMKRAFGWHGCGEPPRINETMPRVTTYTYYTSPCIFNLYMYIHTHFHLFLMRLHREKESSAVCSTLSERSPRRFMRVYCLCMLMLRI